MQSAKHHPSVTLPRVSVCLRNPDRKGGDQ